MNADDVATIARKVFAEFAPEADIGRTGPDRADPGSARPRLDGLPQRDDRDPRRDRVSTFPRPTTARCRRSTVWSVTSRPAWRVDDGRPRHDRHRLPSSTRRDPLNQRDDGGLGTTARTRDRGLRNRSGCTRRQLDADRDTIVEFARARRAGRANDRRPPAGQRRWRRRPRRAGTGGPRVPGIERCRSARDRPAPAVRRPGLRLPRANARRESPPAHVSGRRRGASTGSSVVPIEHSDHRPIRVGRCDVAPGADEGEHRLVGDKDVGLEIRDASRCRCPRSGHRADTDPTIHASPRRP